MKSLLGLFIASAILAIGIAPAAAQRPPPRSGGVAYNDTRDAWAWITYYSDSKIVAAWCVDPGKSGARNSTYRITRLRVEVTRKAGCAHPVVLDANVYPQGRAAGLAAILRGSNGKYTWSRL